MDWEVLLSCSLVLRVGGKLSVCRLGDILGQNGDFQPHRGSMFRIWLFDCGVDDNVKFSGILVALYSRFPLFYYSPLSNIQSREGRQSLDS